MVVMEAPAAVLLMVAAAVFLTVLIMVMEVPAALVMLATEAAVAVVALAVVFRNV
jgi:hypothetical protein